MKCKCIVICGVLLISLFSLTSAGQACRFFFNHSRIETTIGTSGTIAVRVLMDHNDCSLEGHVEGMQFSWENVQVTAASPWKEVGKDLYERSFSVTLSEVGTGHFKIFKDCTREGYEEESIPIVVHPGGDIWQSARNGNYPYVNYSDPLVVSGEFQLNEQALLIGDHVIELPKTLDTLEKGAHEVTVFYVEADDAKQAILIVGPNYYYRF